MMDAASAPHPPVELASRVCSLDGTEDPMLVYDVRGAEARAALVALLGDDWSFTGKRVLDFGCGAGRTLRHFLAEAETAEFWGADIDSASIEWLRANLSPPLQLVNNGADPPLSLDSGSFDLIYALSVFTHLTDNSLPWLAELHRLLRPGGLLVATYMGAQNAAAFVDEPWDENRIGMNVLRHDQSWDIGGPMVLMSDWWMQAHWGRGFKVIASEPVHGQTWVLLRRRKRDITVEELAGRPTTRASGWRCDTTWTRSSATWNDQWPPFVTTTSIR